PSGRSANMLLMSVPLRATLTPRAGSTNEGKLIRTSASPPDTKSARFESTVMLRLSSAAIADVDSDHAITAAENNGYIDLLFRFISSPPGVCSRHHRTTRGSGVCPRPIAPRGNSDPEGI